MARHGVRLSSEAEQRIEATRSRSQSDIPTGVLIALKVHIEAMERGFRKQIGQVVHLLMNRSILR